MKLLVLAGGKGTRLKSAVPNLPKVLAPINGKPFVDLQIESWLSQGVTSITFILHHDADLIRSYIHSQYKILVENGFISFVVDPYPLDTGGALFNTIKELNLINNFLVTNADTWLSSGLKKVWSSKPPSIGIIKVQDTSRYGEVTFLENKILSFKEKENSSQEGFINAGLSLLSPINFKNQKKEIFSLERDFMPSLVNKKELNAVILNTNFIDIGIPDDYQRFCKWVANDKNDKL